MPSVTRSKAFAAAATPAVNPMAPSEAWLSANVDIVDMSKFAKLPEAVRQVLPTLTRLELKQLGATLRNHDKIEILKLPLELREAIYEMVLAPEDSCPITDAEKVLRNFEYEHENDSDYCECKQESAVKKFDLSIVLTCKQIYAEAIQVLYRKCTVNLFVQWHPGTEVYLDKIQGFGHGLDENDNLAFQKFRKVSIHINCFKGMYAEYGQGAQGTIGYMFSDLASKIIAQIDSVRSKKVVHFEFASEWAPRHREDNLHLDANQKMKLGFWTDKLWIRVQLAELVKRMRAELDSALGQDTVILTSNVESNVAQIDTLRLSATEIRFHHHESGKKGVLRMELNPDTDMPSSMLMKLDDNTK
ncbi:hypothetical protein Vi05172_g11013 [Venturia inaequalis]|nr:hypothetical protein Vi05172_g11013 [Venturia inaequalis]